MAANSYVRGRRVRGHGTRRPPAPTGTYKPIDAIASRQHSVEDRAGAGFRRGSGAIIAASLIDYGVGQAGLGSPELARPRQY